MASECFVAAAGPYGHESRIMAWMEDAAVEVIGRDAELAAVDTFLTRAQHEFAVLTLEGEPGIGKTTVWREALRRAVAGGARVVLTRPSEAEAALSCAALADLFDAVVPEMVSRLPAPQKEAIDAALLRTPAPRRGIDERALCASVLSLLRLMSAEGPLVVAVDDAQWLDSPSARVLSYATRRLRDEAVGFLVAVRTDVVHAPTFDRDADPSDRRAVRIGPLTVAALHELIKQHTQRSLPRPAMVQVARVCGGNPFYALEIVASLAGRPLEGGRLPVPASLADVVAARMGRLPAATRRALLVAAALSQPTTDVVEVSALEPAERDGIVSIDQGRIEFAHPLFASAIYRQSDEGEKRRVHRRLAEVTSDSEERARHAALGAVQPDEAIAADLEAAARLAGSRGAPDAAAELLELAVRLTPAGQNGGRVARLVESARFWFDAGDLVRSQATLEQTLTDAPISPLRARALKMLGELHARRSSFTQATAVAFEALEAAGDDAELRARIELDLAYYCVSLGDFPGAERHSTAAVAASEMAADPGALADALAVLTMADFLGGRGLDDVRIARALELEDPTRIRTWQNRPSFLHGLLLLWTGSLEEALPTLGQLRTESLERGEESTFPFLCLYLTWGCLWRGDLDGAARFADEARQTAALLGDPAARGSALSASALVHAHDGATALARQEAVEAVECFQAIDWPSGTIWPLWALGLVELSSGNPRAVDLALGPLADMLLGMGAGDPILGVFLPDEIEALLELGELERAELLVAWLEQRGRDLDRPWALAAAGRCRGLLCAARGDLDGALTVLGGAVAEHTRFENPCERARTLLALGRVQRRSGMRARARVTLGEALTLFEEIGTPVWAELTRAEMERLGRHGLWSDALTATEARVAELAASGLHNREIGERAFLTTKAVEANLTRVYRKLGIRSRGGLARALQAAGDNTRTGDVVRLDA